MRSSTVALVAAAFMLACADAPTVPLLQPDAPSFELGKAPPPWALIEGVLTTDGDGSALSLSPVFSRSSDGGAVMSHSGSNTATYRAWLLVTPGNKAALLRFTEGGTATFSNGAMISNVNGKVSGRGTMTVGGRKYELNAVTEFETNGECAATAWDYVGPSCASFGAGDGSFDSEGSVWTGVVSNDIDGVAASPGCAAAPDFVVTSQAGLTSALATVGVGGTIAINGVVAVSSMISVVANDIRLTCATAGSGLISASGSTAFALLHVSGNGVRVDNLFLSSEPSNGVGGARHVVYTSRYPNPVERFRLSLNRIRCGHDLGTCAFLTGSPGAVVSDNTVESLGSSSGIHVQGSGPSVGVITIFSDNTIVERNAIAAPAVSGSPLFGAVRVRDGRHLVVRHNSSSGGWRNGIALSELDGALVENNSIRDAQDHGILASTNPLSPVSLRNSIIRENRIDGLQAVGIRLNLACWNRVEHNEVRVAAGTLRARFEVTTGANVYAGSPARVLDQGNFDCDGDEVTDPNTISGSSSASSSRASAARIPTVSLRLNRSAPQSGGTKFPELQ